MNDAWMHRGVEVSKVCYLKYQEDHGYLPKTV